MFSELAAVLRRFAELGAVKAFCKPLAENDNSKQQIYLGGALDSVQMFPLREIEADSNGWLKGGKQPPLPPRHIMKHHRQTGLLVMPCHVAGGIEVGGGAAHQL